MIHKAPVTTVLKDQVLAIEKWLVMNGEAVVVGQSVCEIALIQLVENDWMRAMLRESENASVTDLSYPHSINSFEIPAEVPGVVRHLRTAEERIDCGQPLFEVVE